MNVMASYQMRMHSAVQARVTYCSTVFGYMAETTRIPHVVLRALQ
jgi:hypothetical protein